MANAAVAAGADGLMIEVHPHPDHAVSDGIQSLKPEKFSMMMGTVARFVVATGRTLSKAPG
jgi:3-deoxy-7-phosphoheptulonate synthase